MPGVFEAQLRVTRTFSLGRASWLRGTPIPCMCHARNSGLVVVAH